MGKKYKDIEIGDVYGRWTVIGFSEKRTKRGVAYWLCECSCDKHTVKEVNSESLKNGSSKSCGCIHKDMAKISGLKQRKYNLNIGEKYGHWTIIDHGDRLGKNTNTYLCECDCAYHTRKTVRADALAGEESNSCRKCATVKDLTGETFGYLYVIGIDAEKSKDINRTYYKVKCSCGTEYSVRTDALTSGTTSSCGCRQYEYEDLTGQKFGELTVLRYVERFSYSSVKDYNTSVNIWECKCSCGSIFKTRQTSLKSGKIHSCGCVNKSRGEIRTAEILDSFGLEYIEQYRFADCKWKNTLPFDFVVLNSSGIPCGAIEFDGEFHYSAIKYPDMTQEQADENLRTTRIRDGVKDKYCAENNLWIIRIPYWELHNNTIETYLINELSMHIDFDKKETKSA